MRSGECLRYERASVNSWHLAIVIDPEAQAHVGIEHQVSDCTAAYVHIVVSSSVVINNNARTTHQWYIDALNSGASTWLNSDHVIVEWVNKWVRVTQCNTGWLEQKQSPGGECVRPWSIDGCGSPCFHMCKCLFHACAVLALHWCYSHSETAVNWTLEFSRFEGEIWWLKDRDSPHPLQGESRSSTIKSDLHWQ